MDQEKVIELKGITKTFGEVVANNNVNLDLYRGEILSILGENGSGKTSAMNVIAGIYTPEEGHIFINGQEVVLRSPRDSLRHGVGMVHQHFKLVDVFTAAENVVLGLTKEDNVRYAERNGIVITDDKGRIKPFTMKETIEHIKDMCHRYGFEMDLNKKVYNMSVSEKQTLEIIKVLYRGVDILILDEPTAVLTPQEIRKLFNVVKNMKEDGKSIVIITHKLNEVMEISDRVAIFRKGEHIATVNTKETNMKQLTDMMMGEKVDLKIHRSLPKKVENPILREMSYIFLKIISIYIISVFSKGYTQQLRDKVVN